MSIALDLPPLKTRKGWTPPVAPGDFAFGLIQAYDQSLNNTGVVLLNSNSLGIHLLAAAMIRPPEDVAALKSHEGSYARALHLYRQVVRARTGYAASAQATVCERPPVHGRRAESILLAGNEIHRATMGSGGVTMVDNRHAKSVICGAAGTRDNPVTKAHVKAAVERYVLPSGTATPWNEHIRDAILLGLTYLYDVCQQERKAQA